MRSVKTVSLVLLLLLLAASLVTAGCLQGNDDGDGGGTDTAATLHRPAETALGNATPFTLFLCDDGYRLPATALEEVDRCNHRVTKPLQDPSWLNVTAQHGPANEVSIAVNPQDPLQVAGGGKDYTVSYVSDVARCGEYTVWMGTYHSRDGGRTWGNDLMRGFPGDDRDSPLAGNHCNTDPVLVWDDDGTLWFSGLNYDGAREDQATTTSPASEHDAYSGSQLYFARSSDGGASYPDIGFAAFGDDGVVFNDKQWFAVQPGGDHMIATWSQFWIVPGPVPVWNDVIVYSESLDGGATWSQEKVLRPGGDEGGAGVPANGQFSMPQYLPAAAADDADADLAVIWWDGDKVLYAEGVLTSGGAEFGPVQSTFPVNSLQSGEGRDGTGPTRYRLSTYPVLAVAPQDGDCAGRRYVVWADQPEGEVDTDTTIKLRWSDDGTTWSDPVTVNDVETGDQFMPWVDVDPHGDVHVAWYDKRNDPQNVEMDVYYAVSDTCGESFRDNLRVTETSFDGDLAHHQNGRPFIGDYIGVDTTSESTHILWADTRHTGEPGRSAGSDVYSATLLRNASATSTFDASFQGE